MNITHDTDTPANIELVGVTTKGNIVNVPSGITLSLTAVSGNAIFALNPNNTSGAISDTTAETYQFNVDAIGATIPLEDDSKIVNGTVSAAPAVSLRLRTVN